MSRPDRKTRWQVPIARPDRKTRSQDMCRSVLGAWYAQAQSASFGGPVYLLRYWHDMCQRFQRLGEESHDPSERPK